MAKKPIPGEVYDKNDRPIYAGDLLRSFHFRGARRKVYYLYHVAVWNPKEECLEAVPTSELEPKLVNRGGRCRLFQDTADDMEIISGHGPGAILDFNDRPKRSGTRCKTR